MEKDLPGTYYLIKFQILQKEYYTFWYTDDMDGFLLDRKGKLKSLPTKEDAVAFAAKMGFLLDTKELLISSAILRKRNIDCSLFLNYWNIFSDIAYSINCRFAGDSRDDVTSRIYEKLFYGCNILVSEDEEHYIPKWSKKEKRRIANIMKNGFAILATGLSADRNL